MSSDRKVSRYLPVMAAVVLVVAVHGPLSAFTLSKTYDAFVHIFFADHYQRWWWDHWEDRWYTGFMMTTYPPGSHMLLATVGWLIGMKKAFVFAIVLSLSLITIGIYRVSRLWVGHKLAVTATFIGVFSSSICETTHVFGQLPSLLALGIYLNAIPFVYVYVARGNWKCFLYSMLLTAATASVHHVTPLFGLPFIALPVVVFLIYRRSKLSSVGSQHIGVIDWQNDNLRYNFFTACRRIFPTCWRGLNFAVFTLIVLVVTVTPYWITSKIDPISQVPIPHASRSNFLEDLNAGMVFFLIPYGITVLALPYVFAKTALSKYWPIGIGVLVLFLMGLGGTTPIPRIVLGENIFNILTFDRFTFWGSILMLPFVAQSVHSVYKGSLGIVFDKFLGKNLRFVILPLIAICHVAIFGAVASLSSYKKLQPDEIDTQPIEDFLGKDRHSDWRYLTLGFGDQMAWLSSKSTARTIDGNYHSARRVKELTTTPVERLESAKYKGSPGIGSLQQILTMPHRYKVKYIFSNDKFYDPILFFSGWNKERLLSNNIQVWERPGIPPLTPILPRVEIAPWQRIHWGTIPPIAVLLGVLFLCVFYLTRFRVPDSRLLISNSPEKIRRLAVRFYSFVDGFLTFGQGQQRVSKNLRTSNEISSIIRLKLKSLPIKSYVRYCCLSVIVLTSLYVSHKVINPFIDERDRSPSNTVHNYFNDLDFRRYRDAYETESKVERGSFEEFQIRRSYDNGLANSFGKLIDVDTKVRHVEDGFSELEARPRILTSIQEFDSASTILLIKNGDLWKVKPKGTNLLSSNKSVDLSHSITWQSPSNPFLAFKDIRFLTGALDFPEIAISDVSVVMVDDRFSVIGVVENTDQVPLIARIGATVYDIHGRKTGISSVQTYFKHQLLPGESSPFRIDFIPIVATSATRAEIDDENPNVTTFFNHLKLDADPKLVVLDYSRVQGSGRRLVGYSVERIGGSDNSIRLKITNRSAGEGVVPQLIISFYNEQKKLSWVDQVFLPQSIRQKGHQIVDIPIPSPVSFVQGAEVISDHLKEDLEKESLFPIKDNLNYFSFDVQLNFMPGESD